MFERNKEICRKLFEEAWGKGNVNAVDQIVSAGCRLHDAVFPNLQPGAESLKQHISNIRTSFPDLTATCDDLVAERDEVVVHWTLRGTQRGEFHGFGASNREATISGTSIHRLQDGKIIEFWSDWNLNALLNQLGHGVTVQDANRALAKRFIHEVWNRKNKAMIDHFLSDAFVRHSPNGVLKGVEGFRQDYGAFVSAFPDCRIRTDEINCDGDRVIVRFTASGTHTGKLLDVPPTGKPVVIWGITMLRIAGGKITEEHTVWDRMGMMQQIGAVAETTKSRASR